MLQTPAQTLGGWLFCQIKPAFVPISREAMYTTLEASRQAIDAWVFRQIKGLPRAWHFPETLRSNHLSRRRMGCSASTNRSKHLQRSLYHRRYYATFLIPIY